MEINQNYQICVENAQLFVVDTLCIVFRQFCVTLVNGRLRLSCVQTLP